MDIISQDAAPIGYPIKSAPPSFPPSPKRTRSSRMEQNLERTRSNQTQLVTENQVSWREDNDLNPRNYNRMKSMIGPSG